VIPVLGWVREIDVIDARIVGYDWPYARDNAEAIAAHWDKAKAALPSLFNGRLYLAKSRQFTAGGRRLEVEVFEADYAAYLAWRASGFKDAGVNNFFSMAAIHDAARAFVLVEMGKNTANAGRIYFPSGAPDRKDVAGDRLDLAQSAIRELREETGLGDGDVDIAPGWIVIEEGPRLACMKLMRLKRSADATKERIDAFLAQEADPELAAAYVARDEGDIARLKPSEFAANTMRYLWAAA
jgi:8-oxo-dGTP pyrophosphatase MutT (NUDIX family)